MTAQFTPRDLVQWKTVRFLERPDERFEYQFELPVPLADWDVFACWERERFHSMRDQLEQGMVLFDVGTEQGWCNLIYATFVGPENMVLIEPTDCFWPNIKTTWQNNGYADPLACYDGLLSDKTTDDRTSFDPWPDACAGDLIDRNKYQYIHDNDAGVPEMRLDDLVWFGNAVPDAITIDVEGAELLVLRGAEATLREWHPKVWVSIHPDMMERDYHVTAEELHAFMADYGYTGEHLATDHEEHWIFTPLVNL